MNNKRKVFVEHYLTCWNASEAARLAGYAHPGTQGHRLLQNVEIQQAIKARLNELTMSADEVLINLADQARGSMADFLKINPDSGLACIDLVKAELAGQLRLIKKVKLDGEYVELELYNSQRALQLIGQYHKLFTQKHEIEAPQLEPLPELLERMVAQAYGDAGGGES